MLVKYLLVLLLGVLGNPAFAQNSPRALNTYFSTLAQHHRFNGTVLVAQAGKVVYEQAFGYADFAAHQPNTPSRTFPVASITKTVTATAVLQLQEQGKLRLSDPVQQYLPTFPYPTITIRHLLSHTSGLPPYDVFFDSLRHAQPTAVFTNQDIVPRFAARHLPLLYPPGDNGNYDNINYILLAILVEKVAGTTFQEYVKKHIFSPANMTGAILPGFAFYHYSTTERKDLATVYYYPHLYSSDLVRVDTVGFISAYWHSYNFKGEGEILCTARDLLRYDQALSDGRLLGEATLRQAYTLVTLNNGKVNPIHYGLGWVIDPDNAFGRVVQHSGAMIGLRAILLRNTTKHQTIVVLDNAQNEVSGYAEQALKILNGQGGPAEGESGARVFGRVLVSQGLPAADRQLRTLRLNSARYALDENEFNALGYELLSAQKGAEALATFKANTQLFPASWNVYDSYGEALAQAGQTAQAITMYQRSILLNPDNVGGKAALARLAK
jgi:CubicO group peptidase (beta-lactamase class C family)